MPLVFCLKGGKNARLLDPFSIFQTESVNYYILAVSDNLPEYISRRQKQMGRKMSEKRSHRHRKVSFNICYAKKTTEKSEATNLTNANNQYIN